MRRTPIGHAGLFFRRHKTTPRAKCKAYKGQGAMRRQTQSVRRSMGHFSQRVPGYRDTRTNEKAADLDKRWRLP
jgi:hypothetical protein